MHRGDQVQPAAALPMYVYSTTTLLIEPKRQRRVQQELQQSLSEKL